MFEKETLHHVDNLHREELDGPTEATAALPEVACSGAACPRGT